VQRGVKYTLKAVEGESYLYEYITSRDE